MSTLGRKKGGVAWNKGLGKENPTVNRMVQKSLETRKKNGTKMGDASHFRSKYELQLKPYLEKQGFIHDYKWSLKGTDFGRKTRISFFQLDFYNPITNMAIEIHGPEHYISQRQKERDNIKKGYLLGQDITYAEMSNEEAQRIYESYKEHLKVLQLVEKEIQVDYGHRLPNHEAQCRFVHGHRAKILIGLEGHLIAEEGISSQGMVIDFRYIKEIAMSKIHSILDHGFAVFEKDLKMLKFLKDNKQKYIVMNQVPTAENLSKWCYDQVEKEISKQYGDVLKVKYITFFETPSSAAKYDGLR